MSVSTQGTAGSEVRPADVSGPLEAAAASGGDAGDGGAEAAATVGRTKALGGSTKMRGDLMAAELAQRLDALVAGPGDGGRTLERLERSGGAGAAAAAGAADVGGAGGAGGPGVLAAPPRVKGILDEPVAEDPAERMAAFAKSGIDRYGKLAGKDLRKQVVDDLKKAPDELALRLAGLAEAARGDKEAARVYKATLAAIGEATTFTGVRRSDDPEFPGFANDMPGAAFFQGLAGLQGPEFDALKADALLLVNENITRATGFGSGVGKTYAPEYAKIANDLLQSDPAGVVRQLENRKDALKVVPDVVKNLIEHVPGDAGPDAVGELLGAVAANAAVAAKGGGLDPQAARDFVAAFRAHVELGLRESADDDKALTRAGGRLANAAASKIPGASFIVNKLTDREAAGVDAAREALSDTLSAIVERAFTAAGVPEA